MVLTIPAYDPKTQLNDDRSSFIRLALRVLTRQGEVLIDFDGFSDLVSYSDSLSVEGASGNFSIAMRASSANREILKRVYPGLVVEVYAARNADPLEGVMRDPSKIERVETTPETPSITVNPATTATPPATGIVADGGGADAGTGLTVKGRPADAEQVAMAQTIARVGARFGATPDEIAVAVATAIQESELRNINYGDRDSLGIFQQRPSMEWGTRQQIVNPEFAAESFFKGRGSNIGLLDTRGRGDLFQRSHRVQRSAHPDAPRKWANEGNAFAARYAGDASLSAAAATPTAPLQYEVQNSEIVGEEVEPVEDYYLDNCPHLLLRGVIASYGRDESVAGGASQTLTISGESYGKIFKDAMVLTDLNAPELASTALEFRFGTVQPLGVSYIYYKLLDEWVEAFWGHPTGWEVRTRPIPFPPNYMTRINSEGAVWSNLQWLCIPGFFHLFCDHTGALVWEKLPWSGKDQSLIDGRNWEDLPIFDLPSWKIPSWGDRLAGQGINNFIRCIATQQGLTGGQNQVGNAALIYNIGSIRQHGGPMKRELEFPVGVDAEQYYTSEPRREQEATILSFTSLTALECIRWYDRPSQRLSVTLRGESAWRIHTRLRITENWSNPEAEPGEYYVVSRSHRISIDGGDWTTTVDLVRDRRTRYLGAGAGEVEIITDDLEAAAEASEELARLPIAPDEYYFFDRLIGQIVPIGNDPISWARENVIPKLGEGGVVLQQQSPLSPVPGAPIVPGAAGGKNAAVVQSMNALGDFSSASGPAGGRLACVWAVNKIMNNAGLDVPWGGSLNVDVAEGALKSGGGVAVQSSQAQPGDIVIWGTPTDGRHIGIVTAAGNPPQVISNSSSRARFSWRDDNDAVTRYYGGTSRIYRLN